MIKPVLTEKSMNEAKKGNYSFYVPLHMGKFQISANINKMFGVNVVRIRTVKIGGEIKKSFSGRKRTVDPFKKAIVSLKEKEKIDLFETKK